MGRHHTVVIPSAARNLSLLGIALLLMSVVTLAFAQKKAPPAKPIDLNTATAEQLQQLPGIGPVTAKSIIDFRKKSGPFRRTADLLAVRGISEGRFKQIQPYVLVTPTKPATTSAKPAAAAPKPAAPAKPATTTPRKPAAPGR
jgi:competence protein ComEA